MQIYIGERQSGKTTMLIEMSEKTGATIVVATYPMANYIQLLAAQMGTESCAHYGRCAVKTQRNMNARDTGINIKSARMKTRMNVSTLSRRRNSNKRFPARKIHPLL